MTKYMFLITAVVFIVGCADDSSLPTKSTSSASTSGTSDTSNSGSGGTTIYPQSTENTVNAIYHKYFGRDADAPGLAFWVGQYGSAGAVQTEANIIFGAQDTDRAYIVNNTASVARAFLAANGYGLPNWL